jgi:hypothetical protein
LGSRPSVEMAWRGYTVSIHAIIDATAAWETAQGIASNELDSAISKSQVFYWISNRPGFQLPAGSVPSALSSGGEIQADASEKSSTGKGIGKSDGSSSSSSTGKSDGSSSSSSTGKDTVKRDGSSSSVSCENNPTCHALGLTGLCCPTGEGTLLGCCSK